MTSVAPSNEKPNDFNCMLSQTLVTRKARADARAVDGTLTRHSPVNWGFLTRP